MMELFASVLARVATMALWECVRWVVASVRARTKKTADPFAKGKTVGSRQTMGIIP